MSQPQVVAVDAELEEEEEEDPEEVEPWLGSSDSESEHPELQHWAPSPGSEPKPKAPPPRGTSPAPAEKEGEKEDGEVDVEEEERPRWPGWPGTSVFRLVVAAGKVGGLIGRRGETIKRLCEETRARVRVLDATATAANRIVLISAREEAKVELSPAMNAALKIFKHIIEIEGIKSDGTLSASTPEVCSARLLVPSAQAIHLIGKQGATIQSIQETTGATIRVINKDELLSYEAANERIVEIRGAYLKVLNALKSVLGLLRKFLVDHGVLHLFERKSQDSLKENQVANEYTPPVNQTLLLSDCRSPLTLPANQDLLLSECRDPCNQEGIKHLVYGRDPSMSDTYSSDLSHPTDSLITQKHKQIPQAESLGFQITQTMQMPILDAEEIIGIGGQNISYIRFASGAFVVLEEIRDFPDEVLLTIKGRSSQVQTAHQLIQDILSGHREAAPRMSHRNLDAAPRPLISRYDDLPKWDYQPAIRGSQLSSDRYRYSADRGYRGYSKK